MYKNISNLSNSVSPYKNYCDGFGNPVASGSSYILGLTLGVGVTDIQYSHSGSTILDEINAFDLAEINNAYIGQLNMSIVSSFCGPQGLIWGYDIARHDRLFETERDFDLYGNIYTHKNKSIKVYDANNLIEATKCLFGTVNNRRFNIHPGAHVPFAGKNKKIAKKSTIYSAIGIGISSDRKKDACLLMEDVGIMESSSFKTERATILENLVKSIIEIGNNQKVDYCECFVAVETCHVGANQIGCALVAAPYFTLAQNAIVGSPEKTYDFEKMFKITLSEWEEKTCKIF